MASGDFRARPGRRDTTVDTSQSHRRWAKEPKLKAIYETDYPIPALGAEAGDLIVVRPADPDHPLLVVKRYDRNVLPAILEHLDQLIPVSLPGEAGPSAEPHQLRRWLAPHPSRPRPPLKVL